MHVPLQVTFHGLDPSPALEARIREKARKLERFKGRIVSCHVVLERVAANRQKGFLHDVRIHLGLPGGRVEVTREPGIDRAHEDVFVAVRDAFARASRSVEETLRRRRRRVAD